MREERGRGTSPPSPLSPEPRKVPPPRITSRHDDENDDDDETDDVFDGHRTAGKRTGCGPTDRHRSMHAREVPRFRGKK